MTPSGPAAKPSGVLKPWQRRLYRILLIPLGVMAANAIFLVAFTHAKRMIRMWNKRAKYAGLAIFSLAVICVSTGLFLTFRGATIPNRFIWIAHVAAVPLALVAFIRSEEH